MTTSAREISGKWLIIGVVSLGLVGAAASWWFRYAATHQAAQFWGPAAVRLIRDAPVVELDPRVGAHPTKWDDDGEPHRKDISQARGLTHLRSALLQDHSFDWPSTKAVPADVMGGRLYFRSHDASEQLVIVFDIDYRHATLIMPGEAPPHTVSCAPIADALARFFIELVEE